MTEKVDWPHEDFECHFESHFFVVDYFQLYWFQCVFIIISFMKISVKGVRGISRDLSSPCLERLGPEFS